MPGLYYMRLKPYEWIQSLANHGRIGVEGRRLTIKARIEPGHKLILTSGEDISALSFNLHIFDDEPAKINKEPLERGFGLLDYYPPHDGDFEFDPQPAFIGGWFCISPDSYNELWNQIRQGGYADCFMALFVDPIDMRGPEWIWNVEKKRTLFITMYTIDFKRNVNAEGKLFGR